MSQDRRKTHTRLIKTSHNKDNPTTTKRLGPIAIKITLNMTGPAMTNNYGKAMDIPVKRGGKQEPPLNK